MLCGNCGNPAGDGGRFCVNCGNLLILGQEKLILPNDLEKSDDKGIFFLVAGIILVFLIFLVTLFFWANYNNKKNIESEMVLREFIKDLNAGDRKGALELMTPNGDAKVATFINQAGLEDLRVLAGNFEKGVLLEDTPDLKLYETHPLDNQGQERTAKFKVLKNQDGQWKVEMN
jgi:hypothetical protein